MSTPLPFPFRCVACKPQVDLNKLVFKKTDASVLYNSQFIYAVTAVMIACLWQITSPSHQNTCFCTLHSVLSSSHLHIGCRCTFPSQEKNLAPWFIHPWLIIFRDTSRDLGLMYCNTVTVQDRPIIITSD